MAEFHFVKDYQKHVKRLIRKHPIDVAMDLAVGGGFERVSQVASDILVEAGLKDGMTLFDFGCGSGRVARGVAQKVELDSYFGVDIVKQLLTYANEKTPSQYHFKLNHSFGLPTEDNAFDFACAFSVFTHLLHHETYIYMKELHRILKPDGKLVFSFLEMSDDHQWTIFEDTALSTLNSKLPVLNQFMDRNQINRIADKAGFDVLGYRDGREVINDRSALGQSVVILACRQG